MGLWNKLSDLAWGAVGVGLVLVTGTFPGFPDTKGLACSQCGTRKHVQGYERMKKLHSGHAGLSIPSFTHCVVFLCDQHKTSGTN